MNNIDNFSTIYDSMNASYSFLEDIMGELYEQIQLNPNDTASKDQFEKLAMLAQKMLFTQSQYMDSYGDNDLKGYYEERITDKANNLQDALNHIKGKSYK